MRCFAPSISPPIEPVVSRTKTISRVLSAFFSLTTGGSCGGGRQAQVFTSAEAAPTPTTKVRMAVESLNRLRFIFVSPSEICGPARRPMLSGG
jgi:hypothetical protein